MIEIVTPKSDYELAQAVSRGAISCIGDLYERHSQRVYTLCLKMTGDVADAEDLTQDVFIQLLQKAGSFRGESQLQTWSLGIALNVVREHKRKRTTAQVEDEHLAAVRSTGGSVGSDAELKDDKHMLRTNLDSLPDRQREAIVLRFFEEKSVEETAKIMDCAVGTVKATVHQALRALRSKLMPSQ